MYLVSFFWTVSPADRGCFSPSARRGDPRSRPPVAREVSRMQSLPPARSNRGHMERGYDLRAEVGSRAESLGGSGSFVEDCILALDQSIGGNTNPQPDSRANRSKIKFSTCVVIVTGPRGQNPHESGSGRGPDEGSFAQAILGRGLIVWTSVFGIVARAVRVLTCRQTIPLRLGPRF